MDNFYNYYEDDYDDGLDIADNGDGLIIPWRKGKDHDENYYPSSTTSNWDYDEEELDSYYPPPLEVSNGQYFPGLYSLKYDSIYSYMDARYSKANVGGLYYLVSKKQIEEIREDLMAYNYEIIEEKSSILIPGRSKLYCLNGETVLFADCTDDTITVSYKGKEYTRPRNIIGNNLLSSYTTYKLFACNAFRMLYLNYKEKQEEIEKYLFGE